MNINYVNKKVEKIFCDYGLMKSVLPFDWVKTIKKRIDHLRAAETFGDFLTLGLGNPEQLSGFENITYSLRISANVRLIIEMTVSQDELNNCSDITVRGVCDYHGSKFNWYIP